MGSAKVMTGFPEAELSGQGPEPVAGGGQDDVVDTEPAEVGGDGGAFGRRGGGEPLAERAGRGVDADLAAGLGVDERQLADVGQVGLARVVDLDREDVMTGGQRRQRSRASRAGRGSRRRGSRGRRAGAAALRDPEGLGRRRGTAGRPPRPSRPRDGEASSPSRPARPAAGGRRRSCATAERHDPEAVAPLGREVADRDRDALGDVGLAPVGGAERHRRRHVEQEPRRQRPLGDVDADVRDRRPGGDVPVDPADVVAGLVGADLGQLGAAAEVVGPVLPGDAGRGSAARP